MSKTLADYKALLFDVDRTLTDSQGNVSPRTKAALKALIDQGCQLAICSGRNYSVLRDDFFPLFAPNNIHITSGGGQLVTSEGEVVWEKAIPAEICQQLAEKATTGEMGFVHSVGGFSYCNPYALERYGTVAHLNKRMKPIATVPKWGSPVVVITEINQEMLDLLDSIPEITYKKGISSINTPYVDVTMKGINKAVAIQEWSTLTGIDPSEIIGFGDGENDLEFLQLVGHAVAMGNAHPELKLHANRVIGHTDDDGLAIYLEGLLKGQPV